MILIYILLIGLAAFVGHIIDVAEQFVKDNYGTPESHHHNNKHHK